MGMFDYVYFEGPQWTCPEGHSLEGVEFQTKDFENLCVSVFIRGQTVAMREPFKAGRHARPDIEVYGDCPACGSYFQYPGSDVGRWVLIRFAMNSDGVVERWEHCSTQDDWREDARQHGGVGPMQPEEAQALKYDWWNLERPERVSDEQRAAARKRLEAAGVPVDLWLRLWNGQRDGDLTYAQALEQLTGEKPPESSKEEKAALKAFNDSMAEVFNQATIQDLLYKTNPFMALLEKP